MIDRNGEGVGGLVESDCLDRRARIIYARRQRWHGMFPGTMADKRKIARQRVLRIGEEFQYRGEREKVRREACSTPMGSIAEINLPFVGRHETRGRLIRRAN